MRFFSSFAKLLYATVLPATTATTTTQTKTSGCAEKFLKAITSASENLERYLINISRHLFWWANSIA
jgi:hypothetical protein